VEPEITINGGDLGSLVFQIPRGDGTATTFGIARGRAFIDLCRKALAKPSLVITSPKGVAPLRVSGTRNGGLLITVPGADGAQAIGVTIHDPAMFMAACESALANPTLTDHILGPEGHA
jgi:hypothetical protein